MTKPPNAPQSRDPLIRITIPYPSPHETGRRIITSEVFRGMLYELRECSLITFTRSNGVLAIPLEDAEEWAQEIVEIARTWKDWVKYEQRQKTKAR